MERLEHRRKVWHAGTLTYTTTGVFLLFIWLLWGDFAWSMKERAVGMVAGLLVKSFGISDGLYSILIISIPNFTNIFLMPIVSYRSDRHRGRFGRRIPYLLMYTPPVLAGLVGLAFTRQLGGALQQGIGPEVISQNMANLIVFSVFWLLLDLGTTMTNALFMALSNDVVPSELIGRFVAMFRAVSLGCAIVFNSFLLKYAETEVTLIFFSLALLYGFGLLLMCAKVREGEYPPLPAAEKARRGMRDAVRTYFKECFAMPYYRWVIGAFVVCALSPLPINIFVIFYVKALGISLEAFGYTQAAIFGFAMVASYPLGALADRYHPLRVGMISMGLLVLTMLAGGFFIGGTLSFTIVYAAQGVLIMSYNTLTASYGQRLFPKALYAQFNSALQMVLAVVTVLAAPLIGGILTFVEKSFYPDGSGGQYFLLFFLGGLIGLAGLAMLAVVYRYYRKLGGDRSYRPPLPE